MEHSQPIPAAKTAGRNQLSIDILEASHREILIRALKRILDTYIAESTYAQIVDGLPLIDVFLDTTAGIVPSEHPIYEHTELCPGVLERTKDFRNQFDPNILKLDSRVSFHETWLPWSLTVSKLILAYQAASPGSRSFIMRLVEIVAVAIHQIAAILYEMDLSVHKSDSVTTWEPPEPDDVWLYDFPNGPLPTLFYHPWYKDYDQYPRGAADMVGYWAEARILGGVVLFDRRPPDAAKHGDPNAIYFHSDREDVTYRIYQLLDDQKTRLADFLMADDPPSSPLPILGNKANYKRIDPEEPVTATGIYRDEWERKDYPPERFDARLRDVWDQLEFPTKEDFRAARERAQARKYGPQ